MTRARVTRISIFKDLSGLKWKRTGRGTLGNAKQCERSGSWQSQTGKGKDGKQAEGSCNAPRERWGTPDEHEGTL